MNAVVRVGSSGDNGSVSQQNSADSSGGSSDVAPASTTTSDTGATGATDQELPTTGESDGMNQSDTSQSIDQQQGGTPTDPSEQVTLDGGSGDPSTGSTSATTTQTGATNVNVSVRVGSPGKDGTITQTNSATANGSSPQLSIVNTDGGTNTNVAIVIPGDVSAPGSNWQWNWVWDGTWVPDPNASASDVAPTSSAAWNWIWSNTQTGANTTSSSGGDGSFSWTWVFTLADGTTVTNGWQWACSCNWSWTWSWDFSKQPSSVTTTPADASSSAPAPQPTETYDTGPVTQENSVAANANAGTDLQTAQTLDQQAGIDPGDALVVSDSTQIANAWAIASANHTWNKNLSHGVGTSSVIQSNTLEADALAFDHFDSTQVTVQRQTTSPTTSQTMTSLEWVGNEQTANAEAVASSTGTGNTNSAVAPSANRAFVGPVIQHNDAVASAFSGNWGTAYQWTQQFQNAGTAATQDEQAYNLAWNIQDAESVSVASQAGVVNLNDLLVPAGSRATNPSVTQRNLVSSRANAANVSSSWQTISQTQNGEADSEASFALNYAETRQVGVETMTAYQATDVNRASWLGVEPPLPSGDGGGGGGSGSGSFASGGGYGSAAVWSYSAGLTSGGGSLSRTSKTTGHATSWCSSSGCHGAAGGGAAPFLPPSLGSPGTGSPAYGETVDAGSSSGHATLGATGDAGSGSGSGSSAPLGISIAAAGAAGSAPGTGSGLVVAANDPYKLAAPANLGPRTTASALGPPMVVLDPFEWPG